jgi:hypothetical protein
VHFVTGEGPGATLTKLGMGNGVGPGKLKNKKLSAKTIFSRPDTIYDELPRSDPTAKSEIR